MSRGSVRSFSIVAGTAAEKIAYEITQAIMHTHAYRIIEIFFEKFSTILQYYNSMNHHVLKITRDTVSPLRLARHSVATSHYKR